MRKPLRYLLLGALILAVAAVSYGLGSTGQRLRDGRAFEKELAAVQASLWFNHLERYRELEADLAKGCIEEARIKLDMSIDQEMRLLSEFSQAHHNTWATKYITDRDPVLASELPGYKPKYGKSRTEPQCM